MRASGTRLTPGQGWVLVRGRLRPAMGACAGLALLGAASALVIPGRQPTPATPAIPVQNHAPKIETRR